MKLTTDRKRLGEPSEMEWARLAAYIDGEGCISITYHCKKGRYNFFSLLIDIANTDIRLMYWLQEHFGGWLSVNQASATDNRRVPCYHWRMSQKDYVEALEKMMPYLVIKKEQAEIAIAFRKTFRPSRFNRIRIPNEIMQLREDLRQKMLAIKNPKSNSTQPFRKLELEAQFIQ
jgi:hypothetical protein